MFSILDNCSFICGWAASSLHPNWSSGNGELSCDDHMMSGDYHVISTTSLVWGIWEMVQEERR